jgi:hypothetical protein
MRDCTFVYHPGPPALLPSLASLDIQNSSLDPGGQVELLALLESSGTTLSHLCATLGGSGCGSQGYGLLQWPEESDSWAAVVRAVPYLTSLDLSGGQSL